MFRAFQATLGCMVRVSDPLERFVRREIAGEGTRIPTPAKEAGIGHVIVGVRRITC